MVVLFLLFVMIFWWFSLPNKIFDTPLSTVVWSDNNQLLGARIAADGQWRFPTSDSIPYKFKQSILYFEDEYFEYHLGFNPVSITKAFWHNLTEGTKQGGSTISQQVIRLARQPKKRTYIEKIKELFLATRLEARYTKKEILNLYATNAPFGGNVVGLETASWRYFNTSAKDLTWSQSAALAVLPNAPSMVFPGKNQSILQQKRDALLKKLYQNKIIDSITYKLSLLEDLPRKAQNLPNLTPHLTEYLRKNKGEKQLSTTIQYTLQKSVNNLVKQHLNAWGSNKVFNAAILIADVKSGKVLAYTGNTPLQNKPFYHVDMIRSKRSTGSLLKPILYASMLEDGELLPNQLVKDIPTRYNNYNPQNFTKKFQGAVQADIFIQQSLNVPAVRLLNQYGIEKFMFKLNNLQLTSIQKSADYYGLPLILGGAESSLWELTRMYTSLANQLRMQNIIDTDYITNLQVLKKTNTKRDYPRVLSPSSIYLMLEAMTGLERPGLDAGWMSYASSQKIAWKTGTSYGFKDAWSIGITKDYVVGVWIGNANGTGRPNLVGVHAAAPLMFSTFEILPKSKSWFDKPKKHLRKIEVCAVSGFIKSINCLETKRIDVPKQELKVKPCPYHHRVQVTHDNNYLVYDNCGYTGETKTASWFTLPPVMEYYYKKNHPEYKAIPPSHPVCKVKLSHNIGLIYPKKNQHIILPKTFSEKISEVIFKATYTENKTLYWHIDDSFIGTTTYFHQIKILPKEGEHLLTIVSEDGQRVQQSFKLSYSD